MNKLSISQIMNLADKIEHMEWISMLITMNNNGKLEQFLNTINQPNLLQNVLQNTKESKTR